MPGQERARHTHGRPVAVEQLPLGPFPAAASNRPCWGLSLARTHQLILLILRRPSEPQLRLVPEARFLNHCQDAVLVRCSHFDPMRRRDRLCAYMYVYVYNKCILYIYIDR